MEQFTRAELMAANSGQSILKGNLYSERLGGIFQDMFENMSVLSLLHSIISAV